MGLESEIAKVVSADNCSGCGACTLISRGVRMELSDSGYMRPIVSGGLKDSSEDAASGRVFREVCPGVTVRAPNQRARYSQVFGSYEAAFEGHAADATFRDAGSSGGVISALTAWMLATEQVSSAGAVSADKTHRRSIPVTIRTKDEVLASAGSRYAPVSALSNAPVRSDGLVVGKPCEVSACSALCRVTGQDMPVTISFFCAGTPSQAATDSLVERLGLDPHALSGLRYRGNGWPGDFVASQEGKPSASLSYEKSWGAHLGRALQWRCKVCVDGTGGDADIAVGDYWHADGRGFPVFSDEAGNSVVIARTPRGAELLNRASEAGIVSLTPLDLSLVEGVQPLQVQRKLTLLGRLVGAMIAGQKVPTYRGYKLPMIALRALKKNIGAAYWTFTRVRLKERDKA